MVLLLMEKKSCTALTSHVDMEQGVVYRRSRYLPNAAGWLCARQRAARRLKKVVPGYLTSQKNPL
jgi:hypothetical protein